MEKRFDMILGKQRQRAKFRDFIGSHLFDRKNGHVACLPGEHGREIEQVYRKLGFRDENIIGIEQDAEAAKGVESHYPRIKLYQGSVSDFCFEYAKNPDNPPLSVVSLDFCGNFSLDKLFPLFFLALGQKLKFNCVVAVNLFAGREQKASQAEMRASYAQFMVGDLTSDRMVDLLKEERPEEKFLHTATEAELSEARNQAALTMIINMITHHAPVCYVWKSWKIKTEGKLVEGFKPTRSGTFEWVSKNSDENLFSDIAIVKQAALLSTWNQLKGLIKDAAHAMAIARKLENSFFDKYGLAHLPAAIERYSYINDAGHRMNSDFVFFQQNRHLFDKLPSAIAPNEDGDFELNPAPEGFSTDEYLDFLNGVMTKYEKIPQVYSQHLPARIDLGGGAIPIDSDKIKQKIILLLKKGRTDDEILAKYPVTVGTVRALRAHITMGTYTQG